MPSNKGLFAYKFKKRLKFIGKTAIAGQLFPVISQQKSIKSIKASQ
jgi:hypothetical protein